REAAVEKRAEPYSRSDASRVCGRGLSFDAKAIEAIRAGGDGHVVRDLERLHEALELRRVIRLEVRAVAALDVERRGEDAPGQRRSVESGDQTRAELEKILLNPAALRPRLIRGRETVLARSRPRKKSERGIQRVAELLHRGRDVPQIVRIVDRRAPSSALSVHIVRTTRSQPCADGEILVAEHRRCRPGRIDAAEAIVRRELRIA